jgi:hypothetical protein
MGQGSYAREGSYLALEAGPSGSVSGTLLPGALFDAVISDTSFLYFEGNVTPLVSTITAVLLDGVSYTVSGATYVESVFLTLLLINGNFPYLPPGTSFTLQLVQ